MRELCIYPDEVLKKKCQPVESPEKWQKLITEMKKIMVDHEGVGLAAPQVGEPIRLFLMDEAHQPEAPDQPVERKIKAYFNPEIVEIKDKGEISEACLSFPGITVEIERGRVVCFRALNSEGEEVQKTVKGLQAQCVQHESEHLDGVTLADHASLSEKLEMQEKLEKYREEQENDD